MDIDMNTNATFFHKRYNGTCFEPKAKCLFTKSVVTHVDLYYICPNEVRRKVIAMYIS